MSAPRLSSAVGLHNLLCAYHPDGQTATHGHNHELTVERHIDHAGDALQDVVSDGRLITGSTIAERGIGRIQLTIVGATFALTLRRDDPDELYRLLKIDLWEAEGGEDSEDPHLTCNPLALIEAIDHSPYFKRCPGCGNEILEGQHYMKVRVELDSHIPTVVMVRDMPPTILQAEVHSPACQALWASRHPLLQDVFARQR
jgi:hypothetical protein